MIDARHGHGLSVGDGDGVWSDRELRVAEGEAWRGGWNAALEEVGKLRVRRGGLGGAGSGGVGVGVDGDLRRLVGERFATGLEGVWLASLRYLRGTVPDDGGGIHGRVGRSGVRRAMGLTDRRLVMRGARVSGGVSVGVGGVIVDEEALAFKQTIDREIRKLTRKMEVWLENRTLFRKGDESEVVNKAKKCVKCKRFGQETWAWCPYDGEKME